MPFNIVLFEPEIPNNTGNIGRLSLGANCNLHLVKPFGFEITDKKLKRAGLDYWKHISLHIYESVDHFFEINKNQPMAFLSSHATKNYCNIDYQENLFLIFGKESAGLSKTVISQNSEKLFKIPLFSTHIRSLNLANAVAIVIYEGIRKLNV